MPWWGWIILGAFLLGSELLGVDAAFYLIFIGFAAILTGLVELVGLQLEPWVQWLVFAVLSIATMVLFRRRLYEKFRGGGQDYEAGPVGQALELQATLAPGAYCRQTYRGTTWTVFNDGDESVEKGARAEITGVDGLTLKVGPRRSTSSGEE